MDGVVEVPEYMRVHGWCGEDAWMCEVLSIG